MTDFEVREELREIKKVLEVIAENTKPPEPQPNPTYSMISNLYYDTWGTLDGILNADYDSFTKSQELRKLSATLLKLAKQYDTKAQEQVEDKKRNDL